jgi:hypothetical protein
VYTVCEWIGGLQFEVTNVWRCGGDVGVMGLAHADWIARKSQLPLNARCMYTLGRYVGVGGQM